MSFQDLDVWKRAVALSCDVYRQSSKINDYGFRDQLTRSGLSIPSNIAEGYERQSDKEKSHFLNIAKGSSGEFRTQIIIGTTVGFIPKELGDAWLDEAMQLSRILGALIRKLRNQ
jgi:four helix bundle protein